MTSVLSRIRHLRRPVWWITTQQKKTIGGKPHQSTISPLECSSIFLHFFFFILMECHLLPLLLISTRTNNGALCNRNNSIIVVEHNSRYYMPPPYKDILFYLFFPWFRCVASVILHVSLGSWFRKRWRRQFLTAPIHFYLLKQFFFWRSKPTQRHFLHFSQIFARKSPNRIRAETLPTQPKDNPPSISSSCLHPFTRSITSQHLDHTHTHTLKFIPSIHYYRCSLFINCLWWPFFTPGKC